MKTFTKKARTFAFIARVLAEKSRLSLQALISPELAASHAEKLFSSPPRYPRPYPENKVLQTGQAFTVHTPQGPIQAWRWGQTEKLIGLVHGWAGRGGQYHAWIAPLLKAGFSVITYDAPSHGESPGERSSLPELTWALREVQKQTGPWAAVVGHSLGAAAVLAGLDQGLQAEKAILLAPPADTPRMIRLFGNRMGLKPQVQSALISKIENRLGIRLEEFSLPEMASRRTEKALIFHDLDDREVNWGSGERLSQAWPNAELISSKGLGHNRILRAEQIISPAIEFLTNQPLPGPISPAMHLLLA
ncbi:alpha/beta hydrolase [bacterium (Candidatus Blackallbacteria) CG17_big_fil_post_rev_8_21_14_2_50_48_46]|uniref:Alpha/beta hydrolase n=1 Tax=bacterium (Candidatus Blackallbacteria) CG17_big_fil_post_rev_8_21_14_2_50_48_46 TaxID=2014261 RepID=A0A2M7G8X9_9BACT|nr:MAG: alpha/beta hydrolase [bacterium (Candidatus Blackallbacteria) CG18_big_fil_WC_8_21_14_2_50_49_26]PIW18291.1 MAG: alpha/beta hydrolase [bacterium (Candidatus Blackallbacteria) CG17_big_fil_post_rev_8_21_14_2_50_48_46]PIW49515.1 MAG: alpha/beta hydrolase [bacterium (Candidatus Blackallbacteria) CG13_big_fil_rev_8_21_14_2_50_49_14]